MLNIQISTAAKYNQTSSEAASSVTIITAADIQLYGYSTLDEALRSVRGFYTRYDRNYMYLGVRGFGRPSDFGSRVLLLIDGNTVNDIFYNSAFIGTDFCLDMNMIERIEIVRGPGSALYGNNAVFSVINIITKSGKVIDGFRFVTETGSYGKLQSAAAFGKELGKQSNFLVSGLWGKTEGQDLYFKEYDDPATNNGIASHLDWDRYAGIFASVVIHDFSIQGMYSSRKKGIPTAAWDMTFNDGAAKSLDEHDFVQLKFDHPLAINKNLLIRTYYSHYGYRGTYPYPDNNEYDANIGNWLGSKIQLKWDIRANDRLTFAVEYQNHLDASYHFWTKDTTYFNDNFPFNIFSYYLQNEFQITENLSLTAGLRRDQYSSVGNAMTPRIAVVYHQNQSNTFKFLYGNAFRAPNVYEVYYEDSTRAKGNPLLKPEKNQTGEIIWEQRLSSALYSIVSIYNYKLKNIIDQIIDPVDSLTQFRNINRVNATGIELEFNVRLTNGCHSYLSYSYQAVRNADSKDRLSNSPEHLLKFGLVYPFGQHLYAATEMQYETG